MIFSAVGFRVLELLFLIWQVRLPSMEGRVALVPWADMLNHSPEVTSPYYSLYILHWSLRGCCTSCWAACLCIAGRKATKACSLRLAMYSLLYSDSFTHTSIFRDGLAIPSLGIVQSVWSIWSPCDKSKSKFDTHLSFVGPPIEFAIFCQNWALSNG